VEIRRVDNLGDPATTAALTPLTPRQRAEQQQLIQAVEAVNQAQLLGQNSELTISIDRHTRRPVMKLMDKETQEVIRQVPAEYLLRLAEVARSQS